MSNRRLAILSLTPELIVDLCKPGVRHFEVTEHALPDDAKVAGVAGGPHWSYDIRYHSIDILVRSESFGEVPEGHEVPRLPPIVCQDRR